MVGIEAGSRTKGSRPETGPELRRVKVGTLATLAETIAANKKGSGMADACNYIRRSIVQ